MMWKLYKRDEGLYLTENKKALLWDSETGCMETAILKSGYWFQYPGELYDEDGKKGCRQRSIHAEYDFYRPLPDDPQQILDKYHD